MNINELHPPRKFCTNMLEISYQNSNFAYVKMLD